MANLLLQSYRGLSYLLSPILPLFYPPARRPERRGFLPPADIWLHASSVGEAGVAAAIIQELQRFRPQSRILLTLQTRDGLKQAQRLLRKDVLLSFAPVDLAPWTKRAVQAVSPKVLALVETEIWPNLIQDAQRHGVSLALVNGRLSAKSFSRYRKVKASVRKLLTQFYALGVLGPLEEERFLELGAPKDKLFRLGNAKYDILWARVQKLARQRPRSLAEGYKWVVFGSLRSGEEEIVLEAVDRLRHSCPGVGFVLAPRHLSLVSKLEKGLRKRNISWARWSSGERDHPLILLDEVGPLLEIYAQAQVAFVGGSLVPKGGQNPFEPAAFKVPVLFGPHMDNFSYEAQALLSSGGGQRVKDASTLARGIKALLDDEAERKAKGERALLSLKGFLGASRRYAELIIKALNHLPP